MGSPLDTAEHQPASSCRRLPEVQAVSSVGEGAWVQLRRSRSEVTALAQLPEGYPSASSQVSLTRVTDVPQRPH